MHIALEMVNEFLSNRKKIVWFVEICFQNKPIFEISKLTIAVWTVQWKKPHKTYM